MYTHTFEIDVWITSSLVLPESLWYEDNTVVLIKTDVSLCWEILYYFFQRQFGMVFWQDLTKNVFIVSKLIQKDLFVQKSEMADVKAPVIAT